MCSLACKIKNQRKTARKEKKNWRKNEKEGCLTDYVSY